MKKILSLILVMMTFAFNAIAGESTSSTSSQGIMLEISQYNNDSTGRIRSPMRINIEAWYNAENNSIDILYDGEASGDVFLYLNDTIIGYDSNINTSLLLPSTPGLYQIEIVSDLWLAKGYIQLQ